MLYLNGDLVNTRTKADGTPADPKFDKQVREYHKTIKEIHDYYGDTLIVETRHRPAQDKITGWMVFPGTRGILLQTTVISDDGNVEEWLYSTNILRKENDRLLMETPNLLVHKGTFPVDVRRNPDLVYYLVKSNKVGKTIYDNKKFHFKDTKAVNQHNAEKNRLEAKVMNMIYNSIPEPNLRTLAKSWGLDGVSLKDIEEVREELYKRLKEGETGKKRVPGSGRGYKEFIESSEVRFYDQAAALCKDAEERNKLVFDMEARAWLLDYADGSSPSILKTLSGDEFGRPMDALVDFLVSDREQLRKVERIMGSEVIRPDIKDAAPPVINDPPSPPKEPSILTIELIENAKWGELKKLIKEHCPEHKGSSKDTAEIIRTELIRKVAQTSLVQETAG